MSDDANGDSNWAFFCFSLNENENKRAIDRFRRKKCFGFFFGSFCFFEKHVVVFFCNEKCS